MSSPNIFWHNDCDHGKRKSHWRSTAAPGKNMKLKGSAAWYNKVGYRSAAGTNRPTLHCIYTLCACIIASAIVLWKGVFVKEKIYSAWYRRPSEEILRSHSRAMDWRQRRLSSELCMRVMNNPLSSRVSPPNPFVLPLSLSFSSARSPFALMVVIYAQGEECCCPRRDEKRPHPCGCAE